MRPLESDLLCTRCTKQAFPLKQLPTPLAGSILGGSIEPAGYPQKRKGRPKALDTPARARLVNFLDNEPGARYLSIPELAERFEAWIFWRSN